MNEEIEKNEEAEAETTDSNSLISEEKDHEIEAATETRSKDNTAVILNEKRELSEPISEEEAKG